MHVYKIDGKILSCRTKVDEPDAPEKYVYQLSPVEWLRMEQHLVSIASGRDMEIDTLEKLIATQVLAEGLESFSVYTPIDAAYRTLWCGDSGYRFKQLCCTADKLLQQKREVKP